MTPMARPRAASSEGLGSWACGQVMSGWQWAGGPVGGSVRAPQKVRLMQAATGGAAPGQHGRWMQ